MGTKMANGTSLNNTILLQNPKLLHITNISFYFYKITSEIFVFINTDIIKIISHNCTK